MTGPIYVVWLSCDLRVARWLGTCLCLCNHSNKLRAWFPAVPDGKHTRLPYGRVQNLSEKLFDDFIIDALQGNMPGTYMYTRPRNTPTRESLQNTFHDRAKEGFRYWLIDRPKPTSCKLKFYIIMIMFRLSKP